jgi:hypothetical protein
MSSQGAFRSLKSTNVRCDFSPVFAVRNARHRNGLHVRPGQPQPPPPPGPPATPAWSTYTVPNSFS